MDKENLRRQVDDLQVEGVAIPCCMTGYARVEKSLMLLGLCGRMLHNAVEGTSERPGIPTASSIDNVDKNGWLFGVRAYAVVRTTQAIQ